MTADLRTLLSRTFDLQLWSDDRLSRTMHGHDVPDEETAAFYRARLALALRWRIATQQENSR